MKIRLKFGAISALALPLLLGLTGCEEVKRMTPGEAATAIGNELGISVQYRTTDEDYCARQQIFALLNEYSDFNAAAKEAVKTTIKARYKSLILDATNAIGTRTVYRVGAYLESPNSSQRVKSRSFAYSDTPELLKAVTQVDKNFSEAVLTLTPQSMTTRHHGVEYVTRVEWLYDQMLTEQASQDMAAAQGLPVNAYPFDRSDWGCGVLAKLGDLL